VGALQGGGAVETIGLMGLVANAVQIVGGLLVFGDPLSPGALGIVLQGRIRDGLLLGPAPAVDADRADRCFTPDPAPPADRLTQPRSQDGGRQPLFRVVWPTSMM